ncbi:MAG: DapH/DapD/GlmU-related protein [Oscillospiraceae bacterium]
MEMQTDYEIGQFCVIEENVKIGYNTIIGHHVVIHKDTIIGDNVRIDDFACIGKTAMKAKNSAVTTSEEKPPTIIENGVIIGTSAIIYRGATIKQDCLIADLATVREDVSIGEKTIIGKGVTIENKTTIGKMSKIQTNAYITAYSKIGDNCFIAPCVVTSNDNFAGRTALRFEKFKGITVLNGGRIGAGAVILPDKTVFEDAFVGAGSVLTKNANSNEVVVGNPAKKKCDVPENQLLKNQ